MISLRDDELLEFFEVLRPSDVAVAVDAVDAVVRLEVLRSAGQELVQLEVVVAFEREPETFRSPLLTPQHVLGEAAWAGAHVTEIERLVFLNF